jgi:heat shock protein HtpX
MRNRELFPFNWSLAVRMVVVAIATPLMVLALVAAVAVLLPLEWAIGVGIIAALGAVATVRDLRQASKSEVLREQDAPELFATVDRLCTVADLPRPKIVLERTGQPNSWVVAVPRRTPELHITQGLIELLDRNELQAVLAHELSHIANHDATVMTVVGMPGAILMAGSRRRFAIGGLYVIVSRLIAGAIGKYAQLGTNTLSRYRELAADRGAAAITGRPSALASALVKVSGALEKMPVTDLRSAAALDSFHLIAVRSRRGRDANRHGLVARLMETHPSLEHRLAALERLEAHAQHPRS